MSCAFCHNTRQTEFTGCHKTCCIGYMLTTTKKSRYGNINIIVKELKAKSTQREPPSPSVFPAETGPASVASVAAQQQRTAGRAVTASAAKGGSSAAGRAEVERLSPLPEELIRNADSVFPCHLAFAPWWQDGCCTPALSCFRQGGGMT